MTRQSTRETFRTGSIIILVLLAGCAIAGGGASPANGKVDFEFTGTVYDAVTKQPIEGAYVFASYREDVGPPPAYKSWCVKTKGMYTGKDGKYHFPIEKLDAQSPFLTSAIKPGYYLGARSTPTPEVWKRQDASSYSDRNIQLIPQDPAKPSYLIGLDEEFCNHAKSKEDAAAGAQFLRIELEELVKYGAGQQAIEATRRMIKRLESIRSADAEAKMKDTKVRE